MMSHYYFDCLFDGILHPDAFGVELPEEDIADQAQAVILDIIQEILPNKTSMTVIVTVRGEQGTPVYVAHAIVGGTHVTETPAVPLERSTRS